MVSRSGPSRNDGPPPPREHLPEHLHPRKLNTDMTYIVSFFAVLNRPPKSQPVGPYNSNTTYEEMMGLL